MTQLGEDRSTDQQAWHVWICLLSGDAQMLMYRYKVPNCMYERGEKTGLAVIWIVMRDERLSGDSHVRMRCQCLAHYGVLQCRKTGMDSAACLSMYLYVHAFSMGIGFKLSTVCRGLCLASNRDCRSAAWHEAHAISTTCAY